MTIERKNDMTINRNTNANDEIMLNYSVNRPIIHCTRIDENHHEKASSEASEISGNRSEILDGVLKDLEMGAEIIDNEKGPLTEHYRGWTKTMENGGPYSHLFTLCFARRYSDHESIQAIRTLVKWINGEICGSRWERSKHYLEGVAEAERHKKSQDFRGRLHFHVLLNTSHLKIDTTRLEDISRKCSLRLRDRWGRAMTDVRRVDLREVHKERGIIGYLLKDLYSNYWAPGDNISFIARGTGLDDFLLRRMSSEELNMLH